MNPRERQICGQPKNRLAQRQQCLAAQGKSALRRCGTKSTDLRSSNIGVATSFGHMTALAPTAPNLVDPCRSSAFPWQYSRAFSTCHLDRSGGLFPKPVTTRRSVSNLKNGDQSVRTAKLRKRCNVASKACLESNVPI